MMTNRSDRGSAKPRGSQRFERDDVIREPACGLHQGQQPCGAARTGRTHGCTRPVLINAKNLLHRIRPVRAALFVAVSLAHKRARMSELKDGYEPGNAV